MPNNIKNTRCKSGAVTIERVGEVNTANKRKGYLIAMVRLV